MAAVKIAAETKGAALALSQPTTPPDALTFMALQAAGSDTAQLPQGDIYALAVSTTLVPVTFRILVSHQRMGTVIGKGGVKIRELAEKSGARVSAAETPLPGSTERVLTVEGVPGALESVSLLLGQLLMPYNDRGGVLQYKPQAALAPMVPHGQSPYYAPAQPSSGYYYQTPPAAYAQHYPMPPAMQGTYGAASAFVPPNMYYPSFPPGMPPPMVPSEPHSSQVFWVPNEHVGAIIGKSKWSITSYLPFRLLTSSCRGRLHRRGAAVLRSSDQDRGS